MKTSKWNVSFNGRKVGAIGIFYDVEIIIEAIDENEVIEKLYEQYEHIKRLKITLVEENVEN
jgi:PII-like signaling protein